MTKPSTSPARIERCEIRKIRLPVGRRIGDNMCWFEFFNVCVVRLFTHDGLEGWGFGEKVYGGQFLKEASWNRPMPSVREMQLTYEQEYAPDLKNESVFSAVHRSAAPWKQDNHLANALRFALWDLAAKASGLPLYRYLGAKKDENRVMAYASACEFHMSLDWVREFYRQKVAEGFRAVKIKVGHPDPRVDLERLQAVRTVIGAQTGLAADANQAWTAQETIDRLRFFTTEGVPLDYIEDPLPSDDLEGFRVLARETDIRVVGHDYINRPANLLPLLQTRALWKLRFRDSVDYALEAASLAQAHGLGAIFCNTFAEVGIHAACALSCVERIEFADIAWNNLMETPVQLEDGWMVAPNRPGHGLVPRPDRMEEWNCPD